MLRLRFAFIFGQVARATGSDRRAPVTHLLAQRCGRVAHLARPMPMNRWAIHIEPLQSSNSR